MKKMIVWLSMLALLVGSVFIIYIFAFSNSKIAPAKLVVTYNNVSVENELSIDAPIGWIDPLVLGVSGNKEITFKIVPVENSGIVYRSGGKDYNFSDLEDMTAAFQIFYEDNILIVRPKGYFEACIEEVIGEHVVPMDYSFDKDYFVLEISCGNICKKISFALGLYDVEGVRLPGGRYAF